MIAEKISDLSADEFEQAADLGDTLDVFPRVVSQSGGYEKAVKFIDSLELASHLANAVSYTHLTLPTKRIV